MTPDRTELRDQARRRSELEHETVRVAPLTIPALLGLLVLTAAATYLLGPWVGVGVLAVLLAGAALAAARPDQREVAVAAVLGAIVGYGGVMLLTILH